jgi:prepilin-type N-terminal cleavage/methylation domain-containing protein
MKNAGFTLIELLISIALMGIIVGTFDRVAARILKTYSAVQVSQELIPQARYALERMVTFVQESDQIQTPPSATPTEALSISERLSDQYNNASRVYTAGGDGLLDADTDADGLVNEGGADSTDLLTFDLDKTDAANWKLMEQMPDYGTVSTNDFKAKVVICEHVQAFTCRRLSAGIVEMTLALQKGVKAVTLRTTAKARWVD